MDATKQNMKRLILLLFLASCGGVDQIELRPIKPDTAYISGYSDTPIIDTLQEDMLTIFIKLDSINLNW